MPRYRSVVSTDAWPRSKIGSVQVRRMGRGTASRNRVAQFPDPPSSAAYQRSMSQATFSPEPPPRFTWPEDLATGDTRADVHASIATLNPRRHRRCADAAGLPDEIENTPTAVTLLDVCKRERRHFGPLQSAAEKRCEDSAISQPDDRRDVGGAQQRLRLPLGQPVPGANASRFQTFHPADSLGQLRSEQSVVRRFRRQLEPFGSAPRAWRVGKTAS